MIVPYGRWTATQRCVKSQKIADLNLHGGRSLMSLTSRFFPPRDVIAAKNLDDSVLLPA